MKKEVSRYIIVGMLLGGAYLIGKWMLGIMLIIFGIASATEWAKKHTKEKKK